MKIESNLSNCYTCGTCQLRCGADAISLQPDAYGFRFPQIDHQKCVKCGICDKICPALKEESIMLTPLFFCATNKDDAARKKSSSGGIFHALATKIIGDGGVVFGAVFDKKSSSVKHKSSEDVPLDEILRSKYVESDATASYEKVKQCLQQKKQVLFCGTPCQVAGLYAFLGEKPSDLITCDFVCHGVPTAKFFKNHLEYISKKYHSSIEDVIFRPKTYGWKFHMIKYIFENGKVYEEAAMCDTYFRGFMTENLFLRESCYSCSFTVAHPSDITLADFWGVDSYDPSLIDQKGLSLVSVNTDVGNQLWNECADAINSESLNKKFAAYAFKKRVASAQKLQQRQMFLELTEKLGFEKAAKKTYMKHTCKFKVKFLYKKYRQIIKNRGVTNV